MIVTKRKNLSRVGFATGEFYDADVHQGEVKWPFAYFSQLDELLRILRINGAVLKFTAGSVTDDEILRCEENFNKSYSGKIEKNEYFGRPVRARLLLLLAAPPSVRLKTVLDGDINGISMQFLGDITDRRCKDIWDNPVEGAEVLPGMAARVLMLEPLVSERNILGVKTCEERLKPIPAEHKNSTSKRTIRIGRGIDTSGASRTITIGSRDLQRHWQIIGQTGTGKSTLLVTAITDAIKDGYGLTFFDPHGTTIDSVIHSLPEKYAEKVQVVRMGDDDNPVPISMWDTDDPLSEERKISDLCQLFGDIFNPKNDIYVGPRWERWFSIFAKAAIAVFGKNASFESIITISQGKDTFLPMVYASIYDRYPDIATTIMSEFGKMSEKDYYDIIGWAVSKFQRIVSVSQLRKTLGAGTNALDFKHSIDTDTVTLIDLATPAIGTQASRIVGTLLLMQLWNAVMTRQKRDMTHLVFIDEAHLFQTNPLPQMLAESRKFGLGIVLAHQHCAQMSEEVMDALDANSANFSAFRLSTRDVRMAALRFDDESYISYMCKLDAFNAVTTLSVDGRQTRPFTLQVRKSPKQKDGERIAAEIEERSRKLLVEPYRDVRPLTTKEMVDKLDEGEAAFYRRRGKVRPKDKKKDSDNDNTDKTYSDQLGYFNIFSYNSKTAFMSADGLAKALHIKKERINELMAGATPTFAEANKVAEFTKSDLNSYLNYFAESCFFKSTVFPNNESICKTAENGGVMEALFWATSGFIVNVDDKLRFCTHGKVIMKKSVDETAVSKLRYLLLKDGRVAAAKRISTSESFYRQKKLFTGECSRVDIEEYLFERHPIFKTRVTMPYFTGFFNGLDNELDKEYLLNVLKKILKEFKGKEIKYMGSDVFYAYTDKEKIMQIIWKKMDFSKLETESVIKSEIIALQDALIEGVVMNES